MLIKLKKEGGAYQWPEYKEKGHEGYTVTLTGSNKKKFLNKIGYDKK
jgi:hypothetical protein